VVTRVETPGGESLNA